MAPRAWGKANPGCAERPFQRTVKLGIENLGSSGAVKLRAGAGSCSALGAAGRLVDSWYSQSCARSEHVPRYIKLPYKLLEY